MTLTLSESELDLVFAAVEFANAQLVSIQQAEGFFRRLNVPRRVWMTIEGKGSLDDYRRDQEELRRWLASIARTGSVSKEDERVIAKRLRDTVRIEAAVDLRAGELSEHRTYNLEGVQACYAYATALLLRHENRLGKCRFKKCGNFFFNVSMRGAPQHYCSAKHANADRQQRWRIGETTGR